MGSRLKYAAFAGLLCSRRNSASRFLTIDQQTVTQNPRACFPPYNVIPLCWGIGGGLGEEGSFQVD
jgi:hypothetical protein